MSSSILSVLHGIRKRQRLASLFQGAALGLCGGAAIGLFLGIARLFGATVSGPGAIALLSAGPILGALVGGLWRRPLHDAALAADERGHLKDRTVSALEFLAAPQADVLRTLQLEDAAGRLATLDPRQVVPVRSPRPLPYAAAALAIGVAMLVWPLAGKPPMAAASEPDPAIQAEGEGLLEQMKELEEFAREQQDPELEQIAEALQEMADDLKEGNVELKDALATISEMQAALQAYQQQFNLAMMDAQFEALGDAMLSAEPMQPAGDALKKGDYDKAADELDKLENANFDRKQARAMSEKMRRISAQMIEAGQGELAEAVDEIVEGVSECDNEGFCKGARKVAKAARGQGNKKKIAKYIVKELDELSECKGRCKSDGMVKIKGKLRQKSNDPSSNWGLTSSGNIDVEKTSLDSNRENDEITGTMGEEGATEIETLHSPEGRQDAQRAYAERYREYKKLSDAVLESEPIPLGHRSLIRRYFELIRPQNPDEPVASPADSSKP